MRCRGRYPRYGTTTIARYLVKRAARIVHMHEKIYQKSHIKWTGEVR